jgi:endoglucanase
MNWLGRCAVALTLSATSACPLATRDEVIVRASWREFSSAFITPDGRIVRPEHGNDTVSEGQAYGMLRAAWMNDQPAVDRIWRWSEAHLSRTLLGEDHLLAWHWEPHVPSGGQVVDWNPASDADQDYAMALLLAASRWHTPADEALPRYEDRARAVLSDLLAHETARDRDGTLLLLPGPWADQRPTGGDLVLNPSYFAPAWYRVFYQFTGDSRWTELADSSYRVLETVCASAGASIFRAIPDWIGWQSAAIWRPHEAGPAPSSWDAVRVPWRIGTDRLWFAHPSARAFVNRCLEPLVDSQLSAHGGMAVELSLTGEPLGALDHSLANAMFALAVPDHRQHLLLERVLAKSVNTSPDRLSFEDPQNYYVNALAYLPFLARAGWYLPPGR